MRTAKSANSQDNGVWSMSERKTIKVQHKKIGNILTSRPFELLHMYLMGTTQTESLREKKYIMIIIDDYIFKIYLSYTIKR
jgi:hypothetical protein